MSINKIMSDVAAGRAPDASYTTDERQAYTKMAADFARAREANPSAEMWIPSDTDGLPSGGGGGGRSDDLDAALPDGPPPGFHVVALSPDETPATLYHVSSHLVYADAEAARLGHQAATGHTAYVYNGSRAPVENDAKTAPSYMENES